MIVDIRSGPTKINTTKARCDLRNWWNMNGSPRDVCAIYNDGRNIFVDNTTVPGDFLKVPLCHYAWDEPSIDVGDIWVAHKGNLRGSFGGNAFVTVFNSYVEKEIIIPPFHLAYVIRTFGHSLKYLVNFMPLPRRLLPLV